MHTNLPAIQDMKLHKTPHASGTYKANAKVHSLPSKLYYLSAETTSCAETAQTGALLSQGTEIASSSEIE